MRKVLMGGVGALALTLSLTSCLNIDSVQEKLDKEGFAVIVSDENSSAVDVSERLINSALAALGKDERIEIKNILTATKLSDNIQITEFGSSGDCNVINELFDEGKLSDLLKGFVKTDGAFLVTVSDEGLFDLVF